MCWVRASLKRHLAHSRDDIYIYRVLQGYCRGVITLFSCLDQPPREYTVTQLQQLLHQLLHIGRAVLRPGKGQVLGLRLPIKVEATRLQRSIVLFVCRAANTEQHFGVENR